jgi:biopolymer transport protein ExbD
MAIKSQNKISTEFSLASMADLVFLLLIFFMLTSTLVSPNAIKLLLPTGSGKTLSRQSTNVYIDEKNQFFVNGAPTTVMDLPNRLARSLIGRAEGVVVVRADRQVPVQYVVTAIESVNKLNMILKTRHKVILATSPK